ncbi:hypothetical protein [Rhodococcus sp. 06-418-5]|uniref:hypothetical protein n=1 Tax=Rhodococcus sp. 06-418-5 TaxID=2022507 RepID=UPI003F93DEA3
MCVTIAQSLAWTLHLCRCQPPQGVSGGSQNPAALPPGAFLGQQLIVFVAAAGANTLTINHGTAAKTSLVGAAAKSAAGLSMCQLFWDGTNWTEKRKRVSRRWSRSRGRGIATAS